MTLLDVTESSANSLGSVSSASSPAPAFDNGDREDHKSDKHGPAAEQDLLTEFRQLQEQYARCAQALATAAHDLRTPLSVVSGYIELLLSGKLGSLNEKQTSRSE